TGSVAGGSAGGSAGAIPVGVGGAGGDGGEAVAAPLDLRRVGEGLAAAERDAVVQALPTGGWGPTALGEAVVASGLAIASARLVAAWLEALGAHSPDDLEVLFVLAATVDGAEHP